MGNYRTFDVFDLDNYVDNPRHDHAKGQKETLEKLFDSVGKNNMYRLAEDIAKNGLMPNLRIVVVKNEQTGHYDVYDGNRRIAALKILLDPDYFNFLDPSMLGRFKKLSEGANITSTVECYVTNEEEALNIMARMHSGEDQGRGMKQWGSREKDRFNAIVTGKKSFANLIDEYVRKYFENFDITTILNRTTITRIFNAKRVREKIGLDVHNESTFTKERMQLLIKACEFISKDASEKEIAPTRLYNTVTEIEEIFLPWIDEYRKIHPLEGSSIDIQPLDSSDNSTKGSQEVDSLQQSKDGVPYSPKKIPSKINVEPVKEKKIHKKEGSSNKVKYTDKSAYFFEGLNNSKLDENNQDAHGVMELCNELNAFSKQENHLLNDFPIAAAFLVRSIIEQSIIYYSKNNYVQGQSKLIYERITDENGKIFNLKKLMSIYMRNANNFIEDKEAREYFEHLFLNYNNIANPLNWVVHRPGEFMITSEQLENLPREGLLTVINYFLDHSNKKD